MALAVFKCVKCTGASAGSESDTSKTPSLLYSDGTGAATSSKIPAPKTSGTAYSYECWLRLECTSAPNGGCDTFKVYGPDTQPQSGCTLYIGTTDTGATPVGTESSVATTRQDTNYTSEGTGLSVGVVPGDDVINAVGEKTDYIVHQLRVAYGAAQGANPGIIMHVSFEEW